MIVAGVFLGILTIAVAYLLVVLAMNLLLSGSTD